MKLVRNTLEAVVERFDDPGDYPNALAAGPLPSYDYLAGVDGDVMGELTLDEMRSLVLVGWKEFLSAETDGIKLPDGILSVEWVLDSIFCVPKGFLLTFSCPSCNADPSYSGPEPPDHEEY
jgi:hypothetical protein